jgi:serine/threonine-protein kinase
VLHQHLSAEPRRPSTVPDPLWTVIERCLRKNPDDRPSAENLARGLRAVAAGVGVHANAAQIAAAEGVGALLAPDPAPASVPDMPGAADATQVLPQGAGSYDPYGATSVLPHTSGAADPTAVLPPVPHHQPGGPGGQPGQGEDPHPWQNQMRAARDRNEQTQVQYLDPNEDPLRRRPQRQVARPQEPQQRPQRGQQPPPGYGYPQQQQQQQQPQQYAPQRRQPQRQAPAPQQQPQPQRYAPEPQRPQQPAPRQPREPRQRAANPMKIPGLGCLKGCLFTIVILFVAGWLVWEFSPLQGWIDSSRSFWGELTYRYHEVSDWIGELGGNDPSTK